MLAGCIERVREKGPMIHNITNYVTANDVANVLLACGCRPVMSDEPEDAAEMTALCSGLNINLGTLNKRTIEGMLAAGRKSRELGHILVLDPVGAGASRFRTETARMLLRELSFDAVRGNISEIKTLVLGNGTTKGVDADQADAVTEEDLDGRIGFVKEAAGEMDCILIVTGALDLVADRKRCYVIRNGRPEMGQVTGTGCQLSGLTAAFLAANPEEKLEAAAAAVCSMGLAGEIAYRNLRKEEGNASYRNRIIDAIYHMDAETLEKGARYELC